MPETKKPDRSTPAANADLLGEEARNDGPLGDLAESEKQWREADPQANRDTERDDSRGEARPGKDENQAGFLKDKDAPGVT